MEFIVLVLVIVSTFIGWIFTYMDDAHDIHDPKSLIGVFMCVIVPYITIVVFIVYNKTNNPTALDVYRSKTTLEITYKDSIPIDSVVVFK